MSSISNITCTRWWIIDYDKEGNYILIAAMHTTNYSDTFIEVAEDCPVAAAQVPPEKGGEKTVASLQLDMIQTAPYRYTSDDVIFGVYALRNSIPDSELEAERTRFFSKGQPCLRSSPLAKRYGWGFHSDAEGKVAAYPLGSEEYQKLAADQSLKHVKAMRSKRA